MISVFKINQAKSLYLARLHCGIKCKTFGSVLEVTPRSANRVMQVVTWARSMEAIIQTKKAISSQTDYDSQNFRMTNFASCYTHSESTAPAAHHESIAIALQLWFLRAIRENGMVTTSLVYDNIIWRSS